MRTCGFSNHDWSMLRHSGFRDQRIKTDLNLSQIARLTGFKHPEYFSVVFKRVVGQSPGSFRSRSKYETLAN